MDKSKTILDENRAIVEGIARDGLLDNIIRQVTRNRPDPDYCDLVQDLLLSLMYDPKLIVAQGNNQLNFYLARIVMNNIASSTSPFYRIYKRPLKMSDPITDTALRIPDDE